METNMETWWNLTTCFTCFGIPWQINPKKHLLYKLDRCQHWRSEISPGLVLLLVSVIWVLCHYFPIRSILSESVLSVLLLPWTFINYHYIYIISVIYSITYTPVVRNMIYYFMVLTIGIFIPTFYTHEIHPHGWSCGRFGSNVHSTFAKTSPRKRRTRGWPTREEDARRWGSWFFIAGGDTNQ